MGRMVSRSRPREGRGLGEVLSESFVYVVAIAGLLFVGRWYFFVYAKSPSAALQRYLGASKSGDVNTQWELLTPAAQQGIGSKSVYDDKYPLAHGLGGHIIDYRIDKMTETGDKAEADVTMTVSRSGQKIYQDAADNYKDHWVLKRDGGQWRIALENSNLKSVAAQQ